MMMRTYNSYCIVCDPMKTCFCYRLWQRIVISILGSYRDASFATYMYNENTFQCRKTPVQTSIVMFELKSYNNSALATLLSFQELGWAGLLAGDVFRRPKANVLITVDGISEGIVHSFSLHLHSFFSSREKIDLANNCGIKVSLLSNLPIPRTGGSVGWAPRRKCCLCNAICKRSTL